MTIIFNIIKMAKHVSYIHEVGGPEPEIKGPKRSRRDLWQML
jgi:hypothetical protein